MKPEDIKTIIAKEVLSNIPDKSSQDSLRHILFSDKNNIDWDEAFNILLEYKPELKKNY